MKAKHIYTAIGVTAGLLSIYGVYYFFLPPVFILLNYDKTTGTGRIMFGGSIYDLEFNMPIPTKRGYSLNITIANGSTSDEPSFLLNIDLMKKGKKVKNLKSIT